MRSVVLASPARSWVRSALGALVLCCVATSSDAALTNSIPEGTLSTVVSTLDPIATTLTTPVTNPTASRNGSNLLTAVGFGASVFQTTGVLLPVTDTGAFPIAGILATVANGPAAFNRGFNVTKPNNLGGVMPLVGVNKVCLFGTCSAAVANLSVPISVVGQGGAAAVSNAVNLTVLGAPWTQGTAAIGTITKMGNAGASTQMAVGSGFSNVVSLVTPIFVSTNIAASSVVPGFGQLDFKLVSSPEPGTLVGFGAAIVSLVAVGFARRR
jgi:hypothetical protein